MNEVWYPLYLRAKGHLNILMNSLLMSIPILLWVFGPFSDFKNSLYTLYLWYVTVFPINCLLALNSVFFCFLFFLCMCFCSAESFHFLYSKPINFLFYVNI